jgi:uncharacterized protein YggE
MVSYDGARSGIEMTTAFFARIAACAVAVLGFFLAPASSFADAPVRKITVTGNATIKVVPDEMNWTVQVSINDATLAKAKDRHDASLTQALAYIKGLGDTVKDLQTGGIRFDRNLYPGEDSFAKTHPFSCSTQFTFTLLDFDKYGPIADALAKLDGLQVQSVDYASSKEDSTKIDALKNALVNAHDKADALASVAGCAIDRPLEILEGSAEIGPRPMMRMALMSGGGGGTPNAVPGQLEISGTVTVTYDLSYK